MFVFWFLIGCVTLIVVVGLVMWRRWQQLGPRTPEVRRPRDLTEYEDLVTLLRQAADHHKPYQCRRFARRRQDLPDLLRLQLAAELEYLPAEYEADLDSISFGPTDQEETGLFSRTIWVRLRRKPVA